MSQPSASETHNSEPDSQNPQSATISRFKRRIVQLEREVEVSRRANKTKKTGLVLFLYSQYFLTVYNY